MKKIIIVLLCICLMSSTVCFAEDDLQVNNPLSVNADISLNDADVKIMSESNLLETDTKVDHLKRRSCDRRFIIPFQY